jgi:hypothetical protein
LLFLEGGLHLVLDPVAVYRLLGQNEQEFVAEPNSGIDLVEDFAAYRQIVRREPAAYSTALKVGVEPFGKLFILVRVANTTVSQVLPLFTR